MKPSGPGQLRPVAAIAGVHHIPPHPGETASLDPRTMSSATWLGLCGTDDTQIWAIGAPTMANTMPTIRAHIRRSGRVAVRRLANPVTFCDGHEVFLVAPAGRSGWPPTVLDGRRLRQLRQEG
jgi:hypothetical protein